MNKRRLHHVWTRLRFIKPWYFLAIAVVSGAVCVFALRANNEHMVKLRSAVYAADRKGSGVQKALDDLQAYVTAHMNTDLSTGTSVYPPIQLKYTYQRLVQAKQNAAIAVDSSTQLYTSAQNYCQAKIPIGFSGGYRVPCIEQYIQSHGGTVAPSAATIPTALYEFSFVSPAWSPDLAGWSLVIALLSGVLFVITSVARRWFRRTVR